MGSDILTAILDGLSAPAQAWQRTRRPFQAAGQPRELASEHKLGRPKIGEGADVPWAAPGSLRA